MRRVRPISSERARRDTSSGETISASISASTASASLNPSRPNNLIPLSSYGLWEALITIPASARIDEVMNAMPGVGSGPVSQTSAPIDTIPPTSADSNM